MTPAEAVAQSEDRVQILIIADASRNLCMVRWSADHDHSNDWAHRERGCIVCRDDVERIVYGQAWKKAAS